MGQAVGAAERIAIGAGQDVRRTGMARGFARDLHECRSVHVYDIHCVTFDHDAVGADRKAGPSAVAAQRVRVNGRISVSNTLSLHEAAKAGLGIANLPRYLVEEDLRTRRLVSVLEPFETTERGIFVVYAAGPLLPARVREVSRYLVRELSKVLEPK